MSEEAELVGGPYDGAVVESNYPAFFIPVIVSAQATPPDDIIFRDEVLMPKYVYCRGIVKRLVYAGVVGEKGGVACH